MIDNPFGGKPSFPSIQKKEELKEVKALNESVQHPKTVDEQIQPVVAAFPAHDVKIVDKEPSYSEKILAEHNGLESNIPINHEYWKKRP